MIKTILVALAATLLLTACDEQEISAPDIKPRADLVQTITLWSERVDAENLTIDTLSIENAFLTNTVLILDGSGSMKESACGADTSSKMDEAKKISEQFINGLEARNNIGVITFSGDGFRKSPITSADKRQKAIDVIKNTFPSGGTPLGSSVLQAIEMLEERAKQSKGLGNYNIVAITDGAASDTAMVVSALHKLAETPIQLHTIGYCLDRNTQHSLRVDGVTNFYEAHDAATLLVALNASVAVESDNFANVSIFMGE